MLNTFRGPELVLASDTDEPDLVMSLAVDLSLEIRLGDEAADLLLEFVEFDLVSCDLRARISRERCERKLFLMKEDEEFEPTLAADDVRFIPRAGLAGHNLELFRPLGLALFLVATDDADVLLAARESTDFGAFGRSLKMIGFDLEYAFWVFSRFVSFSLKYS